MVRFISQQRPRFFWSINRERERLATTASVHLPLFLLLVKIWASLSDLNPRQRKLQIMEDMDIDQVVEVPDTPDRLASRHILGRESVGKVSNSSFVRDLSNPNLVDEKYVNGPKIRDNGHSKRLVIRPPRNLSNLDSKSCSNSNVDNSSASNNTPIFRRGTVSKSSSREAKYCTGTDNVDKGKPMRIKISSKPSDCQGNTHFSDIAKQNGYTQLPEKDFPLGESDDLVAEDKRKGQVVSDGSSSVNCIPSHSEGSRNNFKGKEKIDDSAFNGLGLALALGKGVDPSLDPQHRQPKHVPLHSVNLPRVSGQKRLVRNGCISPHNIATRTKQLAEKPNHSSKDIEQSHSGNVDSNGSPYVVDISDIVSEDNNSERVKGKGKGVIIHSSEPKENNARIIRTSGSSLVNDNKEANGLGDLGSDFNGGWRTTRNRSRQIDNFLPYSTEHFPRRTNGVGNFINQHQNRVDRRDIRSRGNQRTEGFVEDLNATQTASGHVSELGWITGPSHAAETVIKRHKKRGLSSGSHAECSSPVSVDSDIVFLGSSEASESLKSSRIQRPQFQGASTRVIEVDDLSPAAGHSVAQGINSMNDDFDARARQLEADEMLARELQEQLYHEVPIAGGGEVDEHLAWALQQQEENTLNTYSRGSHSSSHRRGSAILHSNRQPLPESLQNHSNRRGTRARDSSSMAQLRTRFRNQSRVPTRGRSRRFPSDMDLEMTFNVLEALEAAVEDFSDVGLNARMLRVQRDFNDNDYEMLLALDENNHQHAGATAHQINNLPQSTVQSDASEETCAICLETPTIGETVRHLPCLHRFHKDCIDPWLGRRTSCPVCKCSVT